MDVSDRKSRISRQYFRYSLFSVSPGFSGMWCFIYTVVFCGVGFSAPREGSFKTVLTTYDMIKCLDRARIWYKSCFFPEALGASSFSCWTDRIILTLRDQTEGDGVLPFARVGGSVGGNFQ